MAKQQSKPETDIDKLVAIVRRLRAPGGCPWDREQTRESLKPMLVEETYEVLGALDDNDPAELRDELGDLLLQVVFHAQIADERDEFRMQDVIDAIHDKIVRRHPHVFGGVRAETSEEVLANWDKIKSEEQADKNKPRESLLDGISPALPALHEAYQMGVRASRAGIDWNGADTVTGAARTALDALECRLPAGDPAALKAAAGEILFAVVNLCRHLGIDPETGLKRTNLTFRDRFRALELRLKASGRTPQDCPPDELAGLWRETAP